jgi:hypothetical protein
LRQWCCATSGRPSHQQCRRTTGEATIALSVQGCSPQSPSYGSQHLTTRQPWAMRVWGLGFSSGAAQPAATNPANHAEILQERGMCCP